MKNIIAATLTTLALLTTPTQATTQADQLEITNAYVREMPPVAPATGAFMHLTNNSATKLNLIKAHSSAAKIVELHTHTHENGIMRMREVSQITIEPNSTTKLQPGGLHIMLIQPTKALKAGDQVTITLEMADGSQIPLTAAVKKIKPGKMMQQHKHGNKHGQHH